MAAATGQAHPHANEREAAAAAVKYELDMLHEMTNYLTPSPPPTGVWCNVALEAYLLHLRNLERFFCLERPVHPKDRDWDNLVAVDYFDQPGQWHTTADCVKRLPTVVTNRNRINKLLAHLTYARVSENRHWQDIKQMADEIDRLWLEYLAKLGGVAPERVCWFTRPKEAQAPPIPPPGVVYSTQIRR